MLIDILKYNIKPKGIIHVGGHWAQEHDIYLSMGCKKVTYIEPATDAYNKLKERFKDHPEVTIVNAACGAKIGEAWLNIERSNQGQSNSLLEMGTHLKQHPGINFVDKEKVTVIPLDVMETREYDFLVIDVQGFEGEVLKGATETIKRMKWVYTEVNREDVYKGCALVTEIDELLSDFERIETAPWIGGWSDAFYKRKVQ